MGPLMNFLDHFEPLLQTFWVVALVATLVFVIQTLLTFFADTDSFDSIPDSPLEMFSLRNLINFFLGFGWSGILFYAKIDSEILLVLLSCAIGLIFVAIYFWIIFQIQKLAQDNSTKLEDAINKTAEVYLKIPERKTGKGKILLSIKGSLKELDAITADKYPLHTGSLVKVISVENDDTLVVEKLAL